MTIRSDLSHKRRGKAKPAETDSTSSHPALGIQGPRRPRPSTARGFISQALVLRGFSRRRRGILGNPEVVSMRLSIGLLGGRDLIRVVVFRGRAGGRPRLGAL